MAALAAAACLSGCASLPAWVGLKPPDQDASSVAYPNLADIPERPAPLTATEERGRTVESLEADRARVAQAGESLRREIETGFQQPEPPGP